MAHKANIVTFEEMVLNDAETLAKQADIRSVGAFIKMHGNECDRVSIQILKETLMSAYLKEVEGEEMDQHIFANIKAIANM